MASASNDIGPVKAYLDDISKHDAGLALKLGADLALGDKKAINSDLSKARSEGLTADATAIANWVASANLQDHRPSTTFQNPINVVTGAASAIKSDITSGFGSIFQANIWIRVGEVALGLILIAVGVAKITNAVPIATKIAGFVK